MLDQTNVPSIRAKGKIPQTQLEVCVWQSEASDGRRERQREGRRERGREGGREKKNASKNTALMALGR